MRSFIAIDFSEELKRKIRAFQTELRTYALKGRWKFIDNFHLTLKFLGEVSSDKTTGIIDMLQGECCKINSFKLQINHAGTFPDKDSIRVLWLGIEGDIESLRSLHSALEKGAEDLGFPRENRAFSPHVTIGQDIVFKESFDLKQETSPLADFPILNVDKITLFKSEQVGNKRIYTPVKNFNLI